jgi:hypothetical protein
MGPQVGYDPGSFYVWRASDGFAIHLSLKMVSQLAAQISRAGSESQTEDMRGILLGRTIDTPFRTTVIDDFKLIPASAAEAHPDCDDALFEIACRMSEAGTEQRALGFFRAQRHGNLNLGPRDMQTFSRLFCETGKVALLIQTPRRGGESEAALFYWQQGGAFPRDFGFGFPLDAGQLASGHPGWRYPNPLDPTQPAAIQPPPLPRPPEPEPVPASPFSSSEDRIRWSRLLPTAALVVICIWALQYAMNSNRTTAAASAPTETSASEIAASPPNNENDLGLNVTPRQHQLEIRWNRNSAAIAESDRGVMKITEDGITEAVPFDQTQLRDGYVAYTPKTSDVNIRLEVTGKDGGTTSESIRSVAIP